MGNKLCKSKNSDVVDSAQNVNNNNRSPTKFDRIINRLHLKPAAWKSESHLNKKEGIRSKSEDRLKEQNGESIFYTKPLSKSSDWTEVDLEVPLKDDEHIHLRNPKLSFIFDNDTDKGTPTPPPRNKQQKRSSIKERIEKIAKNGLQAIQGDKNEKNNDKNIENNQIAVEEPLIVKRQINYKCPGCDSDEKNHNRNHHHAHSKKPTEKIKDELDKLKKDDGIKKSKDSKRKKNLSVVSLPNYNDLKLSVVNSDPLAPKTTSTNDLNSSRLSLQNSGPRKLTTSMSTGKLDTYITRCRSFGSILPQQLKKLMAQKSNKPGTEVTSDDSFGPLEDWDLGLIEHYNPKDASLPRPRKPLIQKPSESKVLSDIESLIVKEEELEPQKPKVPRRKVEALVNKINSANVASKTPEVLCLTPPPSPVDQKKEASSVTKSISIFEREFSPDPPTTVQAMLKNKHDFATKVPYQNKMCTASKKEEIAVKNIGGSGKTPQNNVTKVENNIKTIVEPSKTSQINKKEGNEPTEHSSLMRILQEYSTKDKQQEKPAHVENDSNFSSLTPSLVEFEKNLNNSLVEDFINAEKSHSKAIYS